MNGSEFHPRSPPHNSTDQRRGRDDRPQVPEQAARTPPPKRRRTRPRPRTLPPRQNDRGQAQQRVVRPLEDGAPPPTPPPARTARSPSPKSSNTAQRPSAQSARAKAQFEAASGGGVAGRMRRSFAKRGGRSQRKRRGPRVAALCGKWRRRDSNPRPLPCHGSALPKLSYAPAFGLSCGLWEPGRHPSHLGRPPYPPRPCGMCGLGGFCRTVRSGGGCGSRGFGDQCRT